jgi:hypothetical protein
MNFSTVACTSPLSIPNWSEILETISAFVMSSFFLKN